MRPEDRPAPRRILFVEDHEDSAEALCVLLQRHGFDVEIASTCAQARALACDRRFDLLISDLSLPDGCGVALLAEVRASHPSLPAIAVSGRAESEESARAHAAGFVAHLIKPVLIRDLESAIDRVFASAADGQDAPRPG
jgi:DNA-binding response OmpR family regulator